MNHRCNNCLWSDDCENKRPCIHYYPIGTDAEDEYIEEMLIEEREVYGKDWDEYIKEYA